MSIICDSTCWRRESDMHVTGKALDNATFVQQFRQSCFHQVGCYARCRLEALLNYETLRCTPSTRSKFVFDISEAWPFLFQLFRVNTNLILGAMEDTVQKIDEVPKAKRVFCVTFRCRSAAKRLLQETRSSELAHATRTSTSCSCSCSCSRS